MAFVSPMIDAIDLSLISILQELSRESIVFDKTMVFLISNNLLKSGILVSFLWWAWFRAGEDRDQSRGLVFSIMVGCFIALFTARILAVTIPFRPRPLNNPSYSFQLPYGMERTALEGWSAFPSDHAVMFFSLAFGFFFLSRTLGFLALLHSIFVVSFPRVYLGMHYPSDILGGGILGSAIMLWVISSGLVRNRLVPWVMAWSRKSPGWFYAVSFLISFEMARLFDDVRQIFRGFAFLLR